jgi:hypothetical protein
MSSVIQANSRSSEKLSLDQEAIYLALGCLSLCLFAIALSLKFPSISEAVALLS